MLACAIADQVNAEVVFPLIVTQGFSAIRAHTSALDVAGTSAVFNCPDFPDIAETVPARGKGLEADDF